MIKMEPAPTGFPLPMLDREAQVTRPGTGKQRETGSLRMTNVMIVSMFPALATLYSSRKVVVIITLGVTGRRSLHNLRLAKKFGRFRDNIQNWGRCGGRTDYTARRVITTFCEGNTRTKRLHSSIANLVVQTPILTARSRTGHISNANTFALRTDGDADAVYGISHCACATRTQ